MHCERGTAQGAGNSHSSRAWPGARAAPALSKKQQGVLNSQPRFSRDEAWAAEGRELHNTPQQRTPSSAQLLGVGRQSKALFAEVVPTGWYPEADL